MRYSVSNYVKLAVVAGAFALGSLSVAAPAQAGKYSNVTDAVQHYIDCANWLVSDPAKHAANCSPGHTVFVSGSTGYGTPPCRCECEEKSGLVAFGLEICCAD